MILLEFLCVSHGEWLPGVTVCLGVYFLVKCPVKTQMGVKFSECTVTRQPNTRQEPSIEVVVAERLRVTIPIETQANASYWVSLHITCTAVLLKIYLACPVCP